MNDILKQRLVGALILVALGVVFWPIIFVQPGGPAIDAQVRIPPRPAVDTTPLQPPDVAGLRGSPELSADSDGGQSPATAGEAALPPAAPEVAVEPDASTAAESTAAASSGANAAPRPRSEAPQPLQIDSDGVPVAWILQVASVSSADKAQQLRDRLLQLDEKAYVQRIARSGKPLYRVYIGPKFERARLEAIQERVDAEFGVSSLVTRYIP
ncbi:MAG: SPOR domain-containing protein [Halioglobus sp.]|nr:SPOR domain-containing protein [Halioglobus sp.]